MHVGLTCEHLVTGLLPDRVYTFYVRIVNSVGAGPRGAHSDRVRMRNSATMAYLSLGDFTLCRCCRTHEYCDVSTLSLLSTYS